MLKHSLRKTNTTLIAIDTELDKLKIALDRLRSFELSAYTLDDDDVVILHNMDILIESIVEKLSDLDII